MESSVDILNELKAISPVVAGLEKVNVFTVPGGYFESLCETVLVCVKEEAGLFGAVTGHPLMNPPQGYFESLADTILNRVKAQENIAAELKELSPILHSIPNKNVFTVPRGYFDSLAGNVLNKTRTPDSAATELKELSPMLYPIQNENVFTVPQGYFESLSNQILVKIKPVQAKVVTMQRRTTTTILKYAVAAVFTGVMALGVYKFVSPGKPAIAAVPGYVTDGQKIKNVDEELAKISEDDIIKYLQADGSNVDAALVANKMDESELPSQEDYLTDDKALDKYLDNIDLNDLKN